MQQVRLDIPPAPFAACLALERELGVSSALAQVLVRRGLVDPQETRAFLAAEERHPPTAFAGIGAVAEQIAGHVARRSRIVVHGDYDCDGVCSTTILVGVLRDLGADVGWFLPDRRADGYGLSAATVERLAAEGTALLITVDCAITAVDEVALARRLGMEVIVTDHHQPRADGALPDAPIVHPQLCGHPTPELCAAAVAHALAAAVLEAAGADPSRAEADLDLVALATVADCVPLRGENRRLVREGLVALARTRREGLRALMRVAQADPSALDEQAIGFRLAPRINAAGRLHRADAGVELLLTADPERADAIALELDAANAERRHVETRIVFEAEAQVGELGERSGYVLAGEGWHPGVIGIVASRLAERHHRPFVLLALDGDEATGSGRSIPGFDLLAGLDACSGHLLRHGGHRAAAGCTIARAEIAAFRAAFDAHAQSVLTAADLVPSERVDAVIAGDEAGLALAEELRTLAPFGIGNPPVTLLVPAARMSDPRQMGEGKHVRFTVESGAARATAVAFGRGRLPEGHEDGLDALFRLEINRWQGREEPRLILQEAIAPAPGAIERPGRPAGWLDAALGELDAPLDPPAARVAAGRLVRDRRGHGVAGTIAALVATGERVLVVTACDERRLRHLDGRVGGFSLCSWTTLERVPSLADDHEHVVALDPPLAASQEVLLRTGDPGQVAHLAWGEPELRFSEGVLAHDSPSRPDLMGLYRALRDGADAPLEDVLRDGDGGPRTAVHAGRLLRVLGELGLVVVDRTARRVVVPAAERTDLDRSEAYRAYAARREEGLAWLLSRRRALAA